MPAHYIFRKRPFMGGSDTTPLPRGAGVGIELGTSLVVRWFLGEIGDRPGAMPQDTNQALACLANGHGGAALASILGLSGLDLLQSLVKDLMRPKNLETLHRQRAKRLAGEHEPFHLRLTMSQGPEIRIQVSPRPLRDGQGRPLGTLAVVHQVPLLDQDWSMVFADQRFRMATEFGRIVTWRFNLATGAIHFQPDPKGMLGYEEGEIGDSLEEWWEVIASQDLPTLKEKFQGLMNGLTPSFEHEHRVQRKDGEILWAINRGSVVLDHNGKVVGAFGALVDVTRLKEAEKATESERQRLFNLLDMLPAFVCLIAPDHTIPFANRYFTSLFGESVGRNCYEILHHRPNPYAMSPTFGVFDSRSINIWEWTHPDLGQTFQIFDYPFQDVDGTPLILELGIDISQSKRTQEALAVSEERYRSITDNLTLGIAVIDKDLTVVAANPKIREWLGYDDANPPSCRELLPVNWGQGLEMCRELPFDQGAVHETTFDIRSETETTSYRVVFCPLFNPRGGVDSVIAIVEDITDKLRIEASLQRAQKLEALGTLAGGIAHEINQPLNALQLYVSGLEMMLEKSRALDKETILTRLSWIMRESGKIQDIITHMRALVHQEDSQSPGPADMNQMVTSALTLVTAQLTAHHIRIELDLAQDLPRAMANPVQLEQVVLNLAVNAMQAMDTITGEGSDGQPKRLHIATAQRDGWVVLSVSDNGPGVQGLQDRIFDPFFTTKDAGKGMGLGLSIVHTFVDSWGGEVALHNLSRGGARFDVRLIPAEEQGIN